MPAMSSRSGHLNPLTSWITLTTFILTILGISVAEAEEPSRYQQIRVPTPLPENVLEMLNDTDVEMMGDDDGGWVLIASPEQTEMLIAAGVDVEVWIDDLRAHYVAQMAASAAESPNRGGGNFGIFHTYSEMAAELNAIHAEFPNITTAPFSIGTTNEGNTIWAIKVSDNPDVDEPEGEVLFDGIHHAREIMTVEMNLSFARHLCENYGSDSVVTTLVDSREIFFVPVVNPDGFLYNEQTDPGGGGLWRKNRRINPGSGCVGVDLNRNYDFEWVGSGSSTDPCANDYRGAAPNSEPEVAALSAFIDSREISTWQSYHSVAGMVLLPWGYTNTNTPDDAVLRSMASTMAEENGYQVGQPGEILYNVNGGAFDWGYGATTHDKIYGFTTEISGSGFWPQESERDGLIAENLASNLYLCQAAGSWLDLISLEISGAGDDGQLDPGDVADLIVTAGNPGVIIEATGVVGLLRCDDPYVTLTDASSVVGTIPATGQTTASADPFSITIDPSCPAGRTVAFEVELSASDGLTVSGTVSFVVGTPTLIASEDFESGAAWSADPTHSASTGTFVRIDPNGTSFQPEDDTTDSGSFAWITAQNSSDGVQDVDGGVAATRSSMTDLSGRTAVRLDMNYFFGQRDSGDDSGDFFRIDLSNDGGATFPANLVSVGDQLSAAGWQNLQVDLESILPLTSQMVLRIQAADGSSTGDIIEAGVDDVRFIDRLDGNSAPGAPLLVSPANGSSEGAQPTLVVENAIDAEGDALVYGFRVYSDADLTQLVASVDGIAEGSSQTSWEIDVALGQGSYYWRAFADDGSEFGLFMEPANFQVESSSDAPILEGTNSIAMSVGPNPSQGAVQIRYYTPETPSAELRIFDPTGRQIRSLPAARWVEGWQEVTWDGADESGAAVSAGVYWVQLVLPQETRTVRLVRVSR